MMSEEDNIETEENKVNEPKVEYLHPADSNRRIRFYASFEEERQDMYAYWATLTPEELLKNLNKLIKATFGIKDEKKDILKFSNRLHFYPGGYKGN